MEESYIFFNNRKIPLTEEQIRMLKLPKMLSVKEISDIVKSGKAQERFKVHDVIELDGKEFEVIGFNHDKKDCNSMRPTMTLMGKKIAGKHCYNDGECKGGWKDSDLRAWLNVDVFSSLSKELRDYIQPVLRHSYTVDGKPVETIDKLFIPSESEVFGSAIYSDQMEGERYEAFDTAEHRVRYDKDGSRYYWWVQSSYAGSASRFCYVSYYGYPDYHSASSAWIGAPLCFCL